MGNLDSMVRNGMLLVFAFRPGCSSDLGHWLFFEAFHSNHGQLTSATGGALAVFLACLPWNILALIFSGVGIF